MLFAHQIISRYLIKYTNMMTIIVVSLPNIGARLSISDGTLTIVAKNQSVMEKAQDKVHIMSN